MKMNSWSLAVIVVIALTIVFWIIPAILEWQKNLYSHRERMVIAAKVIELEGQNAQASPARSLASKIVTFLGKLFSEAVPSLAGKMINGF